MAANSDQSSISKNVDWSLIDMIKTYQRKNPLLMHWKWIHYFDATTEAWFVLIFLARNGFPRITNIFDSYEDMRCLFKTVLPINEDIYFDGDLIINADSGALTALLPVLVDSAQLQQLSIPEIFTHNTDFMPLALPNAPMTLKHIYIWSEARAKLIEQIFQAADLNYVVGELEIDVQSPFNQLLRTCGSIKALEACFVEFKNSKLDE